MYQAAYSQNNQRLKVQLGRLNTTLFKTFQRRLTRVEEVRQEELQRVNQLATLGELSAGMTHEILTPLANIKYNLGMLKLKEQSKAQTGITGITTEINTALIGLEHIDTILHTYLNQITDKKTRQVFQLSQRIEKAKKILDFKIRKTNTQVLHTISKDITITGNPFKFEQVLINLLNNAIDAYEKIDSSESFKIIEIKAESTEDKIQIQFIDFGTGIEKSIKDKIFENYFTTKPRGKGTGLGLPICRKIIEKDFNGKLELESLKNPTIFRITIPVKK